MAHKNRTVHCFEARGKGARLLVFTLAVGWSVVWLYKKCVQRAQCCRLATFHVSPSCGWDMSRVTKHVLPVPSGLLLQRYWMHHCWLSCGLSSQACYKMLFLAMGLYVTLIHRAIIRLVVSIPAPKLYWHFVLLHSTFQDSYDSGLTLKCQIKESRKVSMQVDWEQNRLFSPVRLDTGEQV